MLSLPLVLVSAVSAIAAPPLADFTDAAPIAGVSGPGLYRIPIGESVWRHSRASQLLADVRIAGPGDAELPWLLRRATVVTPPQPQLHTLDIVAASDGSATLTLDLGDAPPLHNHVVLHAAGADFIRTVAVEVSDDGRRWQRIASDRAVYRLGSAPPPNEQLLVPYPTNQSRFVRLVIGPDASTATLSGAQPGMTPPATIAHSVQLNVVRSQTDPRTGRTRLWLEEAGLRDERGVERDAGGVPIDSILFDVGGAGIWRRAVVSAATDSGGRPIGSGMLYSPPRGAIADDTQTSLRIAVERVRARRFLVDLDAPLQVTRAFGAWGAYDVVFRAERAGEHMFYVGSAGVGPPERRLDRADEPIRLAHLGPLEWNRRFGTSARPLASPTRKRHKGLVLFAFALLVGSITVAVWRQRQRHAPHAEPAGAT